MTYASLKVGNNGAQYGCNSFSIRKSCQIMWVNTIDGEAKNTLLYLRLYHVQLSL